jgi:uncharacterized protein
MRQPYTTPDEPNRVETEATNTVATNIASPAPLGLSVLAFTTAILGCYYAGFIVPYEAIGLRPAVGAITFAGGIVLILAGMWEFRKNYMVTATIFTSYGGFLAALGLTFIPSFGILPSLLSTGVFHLAFGLFFLCWTIFAGVLLLGTLRTNASLVATTGLLFVAYLLLTIGELAWNSTILTMIGGWLAIICAVVAWLAAIASILSSESAQGAFRLPFGGRRIVAVE